MIHSKNESYRVSAYCLQKMGASIFRMFFQKNTKNITFDLTFNWRFYQNVKPKFKSWHILTHLCRGFTNSIKFQDSLFCIYELSDFRSKFVAKMWITMENNATTNLSEIEKNWPCLAIYIKIMKKVI